MSDAVQAESQHPDIFHPRINLGCGEDYRQGWHNVDARSNIQTDERVNLRDIPWPWASNSFDYALADNIIEHLPIFASLCELHRIVTPGGTVEVASPHWNSHGAWTDPTHTRPFTPETFDKYVLADLFDIQRVEWERVRWARFVPERTAVWLADMIGQGVSGFRVFATVNDREHTIEVVQ